MFCREKTEFVSYPEADAWIEEEKIIMEKANLDPIKKGKEKISQGFNQCCEDIVTESAPTPPTPHFVLESRIGSSRFSINDYSPLGSYHS